MVKRRGWEECRTFVAPDAAQFLGQFGLVQRLQYAAFVSECPLAVDHQFQLQGVLARMVDGGSHGGDEGDADFLVRKLGSVARVVALGAT